MNKNDLVMRVQKKKHHILFVLLTREPGRCCETAGKTEPHISERFKIGVDGVTLGHHDIFFYF